MGSLPVGVLGVLILAHLTLFPNLSRYGDVVDIDRYLNAHKQVWERLFLLSSRGRRGVRKLSTSEITELVQLYQQTSTDLSYIRTNYRDPALVAHLTKLVSSAGSVIYGTRPRTWRSVISFFSTTFPVTVWRIRKYVAISAAFFLIPAFVVGIWLAHSPEARNAAMPPALQEAYLHHDFEEYYESERASQFSSEVFTNNVAVAFTVFAFGILLCIPTVLLLVSNGANLGFAVGLFAAFEQQGKFWGLILPHGMLEITSIIIAGAAGLQLGWTLIDPGDRPRGAALVETGRTSIVIVLGLICTFAAAGVIEGFVTGQAWPTWLRVGIGVTVWSLFCAYIVHFGSKAEAAGHTGKPDELDRYGWAQVG